MSDIVTRKDEHLDIVLKGDVAARTLSTGFERFRFVPNALPELDLDSVDLSTTFLGYRLSAPLLISSMTGGPSRGEHINRSIATAAESLGIAFGVGSQRIAIEDQGSGGLSAELRRVAPNVPILANVGAAQIRDANGIDVARRAVGMIGADALIIHLNAVQEAVQAGGDTQWTGVLGALEKLVGSLDVPIIAKEVGFGISAGVARRLCGIGILVIDVAGAGGTSWAQVEAERARTAPGRAVAGAFREWGLPTADAVIGVKRACPEATIIASGGIKDGIDVAKSIRLGAALAGQAASSLAAAIEGPAALIEHVSTVITQLRVVCFATGSPNLAALKTAEVLDQNGAPLVI